MKLVIAGAGAGIISAHRQGLQAIGAQVMAVQDINPERAWPVAEELGARVVPDFDALLAEDAELVVILTRTPSTPSWRWRPCGRASTCWSRSRWR